MAADSIKRTLQDWQAFCKQIAESSTIPFNETIETQNNRIKKALTDYNFFVKQYFPIYADADCGYFHIQAAKNILNDKNIMAILEWPREHAKSVHATIIIPMWLIAHKQLTGMILMGKNEDDAANLLSDIQAQLMENKLFIHDFGTQYNMGDWQTGDFTTIDGIRFLALGRNQSPRGARKGEKRPNYAVIDDIDDDKLVENPRLVKNVVDRILGALYFALATKASRLVVAGNRIHQNSVLANLVGDTKPGAPKREGIYHSKVFAIENGIPAWKERYTINDINAKIQKAGNIVGRREFFHETHVQGTIFKDEYFHWFTPPKLFDCNIIIGYFDPSYENNPKSDFKAVRVWALHNNIKWCLKSFVRRCELKEVFKWMSQIEDELPTGVGIIWYVEKQFFNRPIQDALFAHNKLRKSLMLKELIVITDNRVKENKYTRIAKMEPAYSNAEVAYNINEIHNPDMIEGNNQLKKIEPGYASADDSPDADEGAWYYLNMHLPQRNFKPIIIKRKPKSLN